MYPWVLLTIVQLTKKQQPAFKISLSLSFLKLNSFKTNNETQLQNSTKKKKKKTFVVI